MDDKAQVSKEFWRDDLDSRPVLVSVDCITYNQERYIRQTLEGFVSQQTDFRYEVIVHDDASTDGTPAIIREFAEKYPSIIKPILQTENIYSKKGFRGIREIMDRHIRGTYIAYCEGDDYWTDPLKLQKQVDVMRARPEVTLVYTAYDNIDSDGNKIFRLDYEKNMMRSRSGDILPYILLKGNHVQTCTAMMRFDAYDCDFNRDCPSQLDTKTFITAALSGHAVYLSDHTSTYRRCSSGVTSSGFAGVLSLSDQVIDFAIDYYLRRRIPRRHGYNALRMAHAIACRGMINGRFGYYASLDRRLWLFAVYVVPRHYVRKGILSLIDKIVWMMRRRHG